MKKFFGFLHHGTHAHLASATRRRRNTLRTILPLFLIFTILAGTFAPFSVTLTKNIAEAQTVFPVTLTAANPTKNSVEITGVVNPPDDYKEIYLQYFYGSLWTTPDYFTGPDGISIYGGLNKDGNGAFEVILNDTNTTAGFDGGDNGQIFSVRAVDKNLNVLSEPITFTLLGEIDTSNPVSLDTPPTVTSEDQLKGSIGCRTLVTGSPGQCIARILFYLVYVPTSWALTLAGKLLNSTLAISLSSKLYSSSSFIGYAWGIVRDFANIFFIFILLFIAVSLILGLEIGHANPKKMLISVIIIAILLNFSMFFTKIIIDSSNILARLFYSQIVVTGKDGDPSKYQSLTDATALGVDEKDVGGILASAFSLSSLTSPQFFSNFEKESNFSAASVVGGGASAGILAYGGALLFGVATGGVGYAIVGVGAAAGAILASLGSSYDATVLVTIILVSGAIFGFAAWAMFTAALAFLGRLIQLWIQIIFAPFAFVTYIIPSMQHIEGFGWTSWWKKLIEVAFMAPIFMFFLYLISLLTKTNFIPAIARESNISNLGGIDAMILIIIPTFIILGLLRLATKYSKKASGEIGEMIIKAGTGALQMAAGAVAGVAAGGVAYLGKSSMGAIGKSFDTEERRDRAAGLVTSDARAELSRRFKGKGFETKSPEQIQSSKEFAELQRAAKKQLQTSRAFSGGSFDIRQTGLANVASKATGVNMESLGFLSTKNTAGGVDGAMARKQKKEQDFANSLGESHKKKLALDDEVGKRKEDIQKAKDEERTYKGFARAAQANPLKEYEGKKETHWQDLSNAAGARLRKLTGGAAAETNPDGSLKYKDGLKRWTKKDYDAGLISKSQIGEMKHLALAWEMSDVAEFDKNGKLIKGKLKADGTAVTTGDVGRNAKTEHQSLENLEKAYDGNKKVRFNSYMHAQMEQSGYHVHGQEYNHLGEVKRLGHMDKDLKAQGRAFGKSISAGLKSGISSGLSTAIVGSIAAGPVIGAVAGLGVGLGHAIAVAAKDQWGKGVLASYEKTKDRRGVDAASDPEHKPHTSESKYHPPTSQMMSMFKDLFESKGGGGHGGGGGGATHAADH